MHFTRVLMSYLFQVIWRAGQIPISPLGHSVLRQKGARFVVSEYYRYIQGNQTSPNPSVTITPKNLTKDSLLIKKLRECILPIRHYCLGVFVHGSHASGDTINYSDFDGLIILRKNAFSSAATLSSIQKVCYDSFRIMQRHDPLQHHGWFVLVEDDLRSYSELILPYEVLRSMKTLYDDYPMSFTVSLSVNQTSFSYSFQQYLTSLEQQLFKLQSIRKRNLNIYFLKSLLSRFMLLPALYMKAITGKGVNKKESFALASDLLGCDKMSAMHEVSQIRRVWPAAKDIKVHPLVYKVNPFWLSRFAGFFFPGVPPNISELMTNHLVREMVAFVCFLRNEISQLNDRGSHNRIDYFAV